MKLVLALATLISLPALADDSFTCTGHGETVTITQTRFDVSLVHNGKKFTDCKRKPWGSTSVNFDCEDGSIDHSVSISVDLRAGRVVSASLLYIDDGRVTAGPTDGSGIELTCKD